ncbi:MAG: hypothetical protein LUI12_03490 [Clostridiales bacterium]|nr:hypothetical protein [Clostridiales bacterium]
MNPKKPSTPQREARRRYEEKNRVKRRAENGNFQTMLPRQEYDDLCQYIEKEGMTKADFLRKALSLMKENKNDTINSDRIDN